MIDKVFMRPYAYAESVELPVKSSASQALRLYADESAYAVNRLFREDEPSAGTGAERGSAYHRFLQLCDFSAKSAEEVAAQLEKFTGSGDIPPEQAALLDAGELTEILNMPVFGEFGEAVLYREREFLCRLKACDFMPVTSGDAVLVQGAIDLLVLRGDSASVIDYKYSSKSDEELVRTYSPQLALYKKAVAAICGMDEKNISTTIVNIFRRRQINL